MGVPLRVANRRHFGFETQDFLKACRLARRSSDNWKLLALLAVLGSRNSVRHEERLMVIIPDTKSMSFTLSPSSSPALAPVSAASQYIVRSGSLAVSIICFISAGVKCR